MNKGLRRASVLCWAVSSIVRKKDLMNKGLKLIFYSSFV